MQNGNSDLFQNLVVDVRQDVPVRDIFNRENVTRAWAHLKQLYPLLGARVEEQDDYVRFAVSEKDLHVVPSNQITFGVISSDQQALDMLAEMCKMERMLSPGLLLSMHILFRSDRSQRVHLILQLAHCISDLTSQATVQTTFLDILVRPRPFMSKIEERLALSLARDALRPIYPPDSPRQRWRRAIAAIMNGQRPVYGGHTIPHKMTTTTPTSRSVTDMVTIELPVELSTRILAGCKRIGIPFGTAFPVLGQVAATRVLFRHYMRGEISEEEWEFRKREPMHTSGPINTRPMMDKRWYENGGKTHVCLSIDFYALTLPFMPLGDLSNVKPAPQMEIPPLSSFMCMDRFLLRCQMAGNQLQRFVKHPLFLEKGQLALGERTKQTRNRVRKWREEQTKPSQPNIHEDEIPLMELSRSGVVYTHSGSSFGATDVLYPRSYPLDAKAGESPILTIERHDPHMRCRPAFLYLGAQSFRGRLSLGAFYDITVYQREIVEEFVKEVRGAAEWYLASTGKESSGITAKL